MMHIFDRALEDPLITVVNRVDEMGIFEITIGELETIVTIELGRYMNSDTTKFAVSHAIKTPSQATPYRTSTPFDDSPAGALHRAIEGLTIYYSDAVMEGHEPNENWLVEY